MVTKIILWGSEMVSLLGNLCIFCIMSVTRNETKWNEIKLSKKGLVFV